VEEIALVGDPPGRAEVKPEPALNE
jgi:hypothetical protein